MPALPNLRHERFAKNMAKGMSQSDAYRKAGYTTRPECSWANSSRLIRNARVSDRITELLTKSETDLIIDRNTMTNVYADLLKSSREVGNFNAAKGVADSLAKLHGLMIDRRESGSPGEFNAMDDAQLREYIQATAAEISSTLQGSEGADEEAEETGC